MTYMAVEDDFHDHRKTVDLFGGPCAAHAIALWTLAGSWCSKNLTEGFVPTARVRLFGLHKKAASELVRVGLWRDVEGGYQFHEWTDRNPTRAAVKARQGATAERVRKHRQRRMGNEEAEASNAPGNALHDPLRNAPGNASRNGDRNGDGNADGNAVTNGVGTVRGPQSPSPSSSNSRDLRAGGSRPPDPPEAAVAGQLIDLDARRSGPPADIGDAHRLLERLLRNAWEGPMRRGAWMSSEHQALRDSALAIWEAAQADGARFAELAAALVERWTADAWVREQRSIRAPVGTFRRALPGYFETVVASPFEAAESAHEQRVQANLEAQTAARIAGDYDELERLTNEFRAMARAYEREHAGAST